MQHLQFVAFLTIVAALFAWVEVQIEGADGWACTLPTWRLDNRWTRWLYSGKPLTGYHFYIQLFTLAVVHLPFGLCLAPFSLRSEARVLSFLILFWIVEDFLWFLFNPAFGLKRFRREHIWWHASTWWWLMPRDYWLFLPAGIVLYWFSVAR